MAVAYAASYEHSLANSYTESHLVTTSDSNALADQRTATHSNALAVIGSNPYSKPSGADSTEPDRYGDSHAATSPHRDLDTNGRCNTAAYISLSTRNGNCNGAPKGPTQ